MLFSLFPISLIVFLKYIGVSISILSPKDQRRLCNLFKMVHGYLKKAGAKNKKIRIIRYKCNNLCKHCLRRLRDTSISFNKNRMPTLLR